MNLLKFFVALWSVLFALAGSAKADAFGLGNGQNGAFAPSSSTSINNYASVVSAVPVGASVLEVDDASVFNVGQLILIWQTNGFDGSPMVAVPTIDGDASSAGRYELARISSVDASATPDRLQLDANLSNLAEYPAGNTQVISVPEYTTVNIAANVTLSPGMIWNGSKGGAVVFLAQGVVILEGNISADAAGFRGGITNQAVGCGGTASSGGRGEGLLSSDYNVRDRYNGTIGGGGPSCDDAGGAGGGLGGRGGIGGANDNADGPLSGGAAISFNPTTRLHLGGGGGAGGSNNSTGSNGGAGGGVILLRALRVLGSGSVHSQGQSTQPSQGDGAGGGGAGGTIVMEVQDFVSAINVRAQGGSGAPGPFLSYQHGGGGGGAGGVVHVLATNSQAVSNVEGGSAQCAGRASYGGRGKSNISSTFACTGDSDCSLNTRCDLSSRLCLSSNCLFCANDQACNDANECTIDRCIRNRCFHSNPLPGLACSGGTMACNGSEEAPFCNGCTSDAQCNGQTPHCNTSTFTCEANGLSNRVIYYTFGSDNYASVTESGSMPIDDRNFEIDGVVIEAPPGDGFLLANENALRTPLCVSPGSHTIVTHVSGGFGGNHAYISVVETSRGDVLAGTTNSIQTDQGPVGCPNYTFDSSYWTSRGMNAVWASMACAQYQSATFTLPINVPNSSRGCLCPGGATVCRFDACATLNCSDGNDCTDDSCLGGVCSNVPKQEGASCGMGRCSASQICILPMEDAGLDSGLDSGLDGGVDAQADAGVDVSLDAQIDASNDAMGDEAEASAFPVGGQLSGSGCTCRMIETRGSISWIACGSWAMVLFVAKRLRRRKNQSRCE